jgi:hypothetical protein
MITPAKPAKNWGQPTLSQGAVIRRKNAPIIAAARTERAVPDFPPHPQIPVRAVLTSPRLHFPDRTRDLINPWRKPGDSDKVPA